MGFWNKWRKEIKLNFKIWDENKISLQENRLTLCIRIGFIISTCNPWLSNKFFQAWRETDEILRKKALFMPYFEYYKNKLLGQRQLSINSGLYFHHFTHLSHSLYLSLSTLSFNILSFILSQFLQANGHGINIEHQWKRITLSHDVYFWDLI